jgi:hypothetical protein
MRQIKEIQNRLNSGDWDAEYCHPHKWSDRDMDGCLYRLNKAHFSLAEVSEAVSENLDEIVQLMSDCEYQRSFVDVASEYIADRLAWKKLQKSTCTWPESATFSLILQ